MPTRLNNPLVRDAVYIAENYSSREISDILGISIAGAANLPSNQEAEREEKEK